MIQIESFEMGAVAVGVTVVHESGMVQFFGPTYVMMRLRTRPRWPGFSGVG